MAHALWTRLKPLQKTLGLPEEVVTRPVTVTRRARWWPRDLPRAGHRRQGSVATVGVVLSLGESPKATRWLTRVWIQRVLSTFAAAGQVLKRPEGALSGRSVGGGGGERVAYVRIGYRQKDPSGVNDIRKPVSLSIHRPP